MQPHSLGNSEGIIVYRAPYGEADLILRVITAQEGRLTFIAKGARTSKKRFPTALDLFNLGEFSYRLPLESYSSSSGMIVLGSFAPKRAFKVLFEDLDKLTLCFVLAECFDALTPDHSRAQSDRSPNPLLQLTETLSALESAPTLKDSLKMVFFGLVDLLSASGFYPTEELKPASYKNLIQMVTAIESLINRQLLTKPELIKTLDHFIKSAEKVPI